jgi:PilZ domain
MSAMSQKLTMPERRKQARSRVYLGCRITTDPRLTGFDGVVRNTSDAGARLAVPATATIPNQFELYIPHRQTACVVRTRWRRCDEVGVEIEAAQPDAAPISLALARRAKRAEAENARLKRLLAEPSE